MVAIARNAMTYEAAPLLLRCGGDNWNSALEDFARSRIDRALGRFAERIRAIDVWLEDVNGPRGGVDMRCRIDVELKRGGRVSVTGLASSPHEAIALAATRARRSVVRRITRRRTQRYVLT